MMAVLVGDDVGLGERAALRAERLVQLLEEAEVDVDHLVGRTVERADVVDAVPQPVWVEPVKKTVCAGV